MTTTEKNSDRNIVVTALSQTREFRDLDELAGFVEEVVRTRGAIFDPFEIRAIQQLAELANGEASPDVARIARNTAFHAPSRPPRPPTPWDEKLVKAEVRLVSAEAAWDEARGKRNEVFRSGERRLAEVRLTEVHEVVLSHRLAQIGSEVGEELSIADDAVRVVRDELQRAVARKNALGLAVGRWRSDQAVRFHNHENPSKPLTLAEMGARRRSK